MHSSLSHATRGGHARGMSWRGRGRGREGRPSDSLSDTTAVPDMSRKPRLTHFLALPIGHHADLRTKMNNFATSLLAMDPQISGLDKSVVIPSRRLHFTLGVMALDSAESSAGAPVMTLRAAIALLQSLKPQVHEILAKPPPLSELQPSGRGASSSRKVRVTLDAMDVMKMEKNDMAHVVWIGPEEGNSKNAASWETRRFREICDFIHGSFKNAGFVVEDRPLKLHCTIINTTYRKPKPRGGKRLPISYRELVQAPWFRDKSLPEGSNASSRIDRQTSQRRSLKTVEFGTWDIDQIQICEMGSWGAEGEYVSVASIPLV